MSRVTDRFSRTLGAVDKVLVRTTAVLLAMLFVAQAALLVPEIRHAVSAVERLEGESLLVARRISPEPRPAVPPVQGSVTILSRNGRHESAILLVNGEEVADFSAGVVTAEVRAGDLIEIDGGTRQTSLVFVITEVSPEIASPALGLTVETKGTIEIVGRVRTR